MPTTSHQIAKGAIWMVSLKLAERSLGLVSTIILAHLLVPQDFGLIAMAMTIIAALELLGAFSFDMALIQNLQADRRHYDTVWTFNLIFAAISAALLVLLAGAMAAFYSEPRLEYVMYWLSLGTLIQGFENVGVVAFRKQMEFDKEFKFLFGKKISSVLVTIPLAIAFESYWALVFGMITGKVVGVLLSYTTHPYRPRFSFAAYHDLFHFSKWMLLNNIIGFLRTRAADFFVGKLSGPHSLGVFVMSSEIANLPTTELCAPINRAVFPGFSNLTKDMDEFRRNFVGIAGMIALLALPAALGITVTAELLVPVLLGPNWLDAIPLIQILALNGCLLAIQNNNGLAMLAMGRPKLLTYLNALTAVLLLSSVSVLTYYYGAVGTAVAFLGTTILLFPVNYYYALKLLNLRATTLFAVMWRPLVAVLLMTAIVKLYIYSFTDAITFASKLLLLLSAVALGALAYIAIIFLLWSLSGYPRGAEQYIVAYLRKRFRSGET